MVELIVRIHDREVQVTCDLERHDLLADDGDRLLAALILDSLLELRGSFRDMGRRIEQAHERFLDHTEG